MNLSFVCVTLPIINIPVGFLKTKCYNVVRDCGERERERERESCLKYESVKKKSRGKAEEKEDAGVKTVNLK